MSVLTRRMLWIGGTGVFLAWMIWFSHADELVLEEPVGVPVLPFGTQEDLKLARGWGPFDRGSLRLVCTSARELRLVMQARLPSRDIPGQGRPRSAETIAAELAAANDIEAVLYVDGQATHGMKLTGARLVAMRPSVDTIASAPLTPAQLEGLTQWFDEAWLKRIGLMTLEQGIFMHGFTRGDAIANLAARCAANP